MKINPAQKCSAMTLMEVLFVLAALMVLAVLLLPRGHGAVRTPRISCVNNLKQVGLAYQLWAGDHGDKYPMDVSVTNGGTMELSDTGKDAWLNFQVMSNELSTSKILHCPADADRVVVFDFSTNFLANNVSYFIGLNTDKNDPQAFLSGDDNFEIDGVPVKSGLLELPTNAPITWTTARHNREGNIGLADGSVQELTESGLTNLLSQTGIATNRLAIP